MKHVRVAELDSRRGKDQSFFIAINKKIQTNLCTLDIVGIQIDVRFTKRGSDVGYERLKNNQDHRSDGPKSVQDADGDDNSVLVDLDEEEENDKEDCTKH